MSVELKVSGMSCQHCVRAVKQALEAVSGVDQVEVDLAAGRASVSGTAAADALIVAVAAEGYGADLDSTSN